MTDSTCPTCGTALPALLAHLEEASSAAPRQADVEQRVAEIRRRYAPGPHDSRAFINNAYDDVPWLLARLAEAEARNLMSFCAWCGGEFPHPSRAAREEAVPAHALDCPKRPELRLIEAIETYREVLWRAVQAEDPDEWVSGALDLLDPEWRTRGSIEGPSPATPERGTTDEEE